MTGLMETLQYLGIAALGLLVRAALFLVVIGVVVVVLAPLVYAFDGGRELLRRAAGRRQFHGLNWRRSLSYTPGHLWLRQEAETLRLGIDDLAGHLLRRASAVLLPQAGAHLREGQPLATFDIDGLRLALPAPFEGTVSRINGRVALNPALAIEEPYGGGWLVDFAPADDRPAALPRRAEARRWFEREASRFAFAIDKATGIAMADGGEPVTPGGPALGETEFARLAHQFLRADVTARPVR